MAEFVSQWAAGLSHGITVTVAAAAASVTAMVAIGVPLPRATSVSGIVVDSVLKLLREAFESGLVCR